MVKPPLVVVVWHDAWVREDPVALIDAPMHHIPTEVTTIGWVLHQDAVGISLANEYYDESWRGRTFIPAGMIQSVTPFKLARPRLVKLAPEPDPA